MHYVILRDDDTNALTPIANLDLLYRPFLDRGLSVNLAVIPEVRASVRLPDGKLEGFLPANAPETTGTVPIAQNQELVNYLKENRLYHVLQHGCHHDYFEFNVSDPSEIAHRVRTGNERLLEAGFQKPRTFVAPYDKISRQSYEEITSRFDVVSTGWFELGRLPRTWWPGYFVKKATRARHWQANGSYLLSHPGCILSCHHSYEGMLNRVKTAVESSKLTVLVTHWWEYFRGGTADRPFIDILHSTAEWLKSRKDIKVVSFTDLANGEVPLS